MEDTKTLSGYILSIVALVLAFFNPFPALIFSIISLVQCSKQKNKLSHQGKVMSIIAMILSIILIIVAFLISFEVITLPTLPI
jgi:Na+-driven multidrug efflux pump